MSRHYSMGTFLRQTPNELLKEYFADRDLLWKVDFEKLKKTETAPILAAVAELADDERQEVEVDFRTIFDLADKAGTAIIVDEARVLELGIEDDLEAMENHYARAMWLFLNPIHGGENLFETCSVLAQMKSLSFAASKRRNGLPAAEPKHDSATVEAVAQAISHLYRQQGRGHQCTVTYCYRPDPGRHCYFGFPEDYSTSDLGYEGGELKRRSRKSVFEICLVYRPEEGVLEVAAPGGKKDAQALQEVFCRIALGLPRVPPAKTARAYELNMLKDPGFSFTTDAADRIEAVELLAMRVNEVGSPRRRLTFEQDPRSGKPLRDWIERSLNADQVPWAMVDVNQIRVRLTYRGDPKKKKPTHTFTVTSPDSTTLKDDPRDQIAKRCLARWKIAP